MDTDRRNRMRRLQKAAAAEPAEAPVAKKQLREFDKTVLDVLVAQIRKSQEHMAATTAVKFVLDAREALMDTPVTDPSACVLATTTLTRTQTDLNLAMKTLRHSPAYLTLLREAEDCGHATADAHILVDKGLFE